MMNNTINETKNSLEGINSRITEAEEWISDLEDKIVEFNSWTKEIKGWLVSAPEGEILEGHHLKCLV